MASLFGAGGLGLRALATGLPASFLFNPRRALADVPPSGCVASGKAQYIIFNTLGSGDPINANVPGMYDSDGGSSKLAIEHPGPSSDGTLDMSPKQLSLSGQKFYAAAPWATLAPDVLDRTCFFHTMTNTPVHPKEQQVLTLGPNGGVTYQNEMFPSLLAAQMAPCLNTLQAAPVSLGASSPSEALRFQGQAQPIMPPLALKDTLANPDGPLSDLHLQRLRDDTLSGLYGTYKASTPAQKQFMDSFLTAQASARHISQDLLGALSSIKDNTAPWQIVAAIALIQMNVSPVIAIRIPFGGDNHSDAGLAKEASETVAGVGLIASLMTKLDTTNLPNGMKMSDAVSFVTLNVFGRTLLKGQNQDGRQHNPNHQVSIAIGKPFKGGVIGGVATTTLNSSKGDYGATNIDPNSGMSVAGSGIAQLDTLASFGSTVLAAVGVPKATIAGADGKPGLINGGTVITAALAT